MQNAAGGDASVQFDDQEALYGAIVSNLVSLADGVQASMKLIESTIAEHGADRVAAGHRQPVGLTGRA
jgi:hypothetical protein